MIQGKLLKEDGDSLLLEDGGAILLELLIEWVTDDKPRYAGRYHYGGEGAGRHKYGDHIKYGGFNIWETQQKPPP
jgi:hypothetical protein